MLDPGNIEIEMEGGGGGSNFHGGSGGPAPITVGSVFKDEQNNANALDMELKNRNDAI